MGWERNRPGEQEAETAWQAARAYAVHLARGGEPARDVRPGPLLQPGEQASFQTSATYERLYGGDGSYAKVSTFAFGRPAFLIGTVGATIAVNAARRRQAQRAAQQTWRDRRETRVVATDRRLFVTTAPVGGLSFWFHGMSEFYPEPSDWTMVMVWPDIPPLRLSGLAAPYLAVHIASRLMPDEWVQWPQMQRLLG